MKAYFIANTGVLLCHETEKILIDALHIGAGTIFKTVPTQVVTSITTGVGIFQDISCAVATHSHIDHFSNKQYDSLIENQPECLVCLTQDSADMLKNKTNVKILTGERMNIFKGEYFTVWAIKTAHQGERFADVDNYSICVEYKGKRLWLLSDGVLEKEQIDNFTDEKQDDIVFVNPFHMQSSRQMPIILKALDPSNVVIYHMPIPSKENEWVDFILKKGMKDYSDVFKKMTIIGNCMQEIEL